MLHSNKMILIPHTTAEEQQSSDRLLSNLDQEMMKILENKNISEDIKMTQYGQVLQRYQSEIRKREKPFEIEMREKGPVEILTDNFDDTIMNTVPKKWHKQAALLLHYTRRNKKMAWSDKGELIFQGNKITGSNIVDLVSDLSRDRRKSKPPFGAEVFLRNLIEDNVPREIIVNKNRLHLLNEPVYLAEKPDNNEHHTPTQSGKGVLENWSQFI